VILASPFLWALMAKHPNTIAYNNLWKDSQSSSGPLFLIKAIRIGIGIGLIVFWAFRIFVYDPAIIIAVPVVLALLFVARKWIRSFYERIENRFVRNLYARERAENSTFSASVRRQSQLMESELKPWAAHIVELRVPAESAYIGRTLEDLGWRETYGINIVYVKRADHLTPLPARSTLLLPFDEVGILATDEQIKLFKPVFDHVADTHANGVKVEDFALQKFIIEDHSLLKGKTIRDSGLRENTIGLIIGILRGTQRILNPDSGTVFETGDIVWIVGEKRRVDQFLHKNKS
jgi:CPA2 family monovalent cation:H+ antiporter-2